MDYRHVVITGASSGFGAAFARTLIGKCASLHLIARREGVLLEMASSFRSERPELTVTTYGCDLSRPASRDTLVKRLSALSPGRTLLINNAGLGDYGDFISSSPEKNDQIMQVNMLAMVELTRALLPFMKEQGGGIVNIASLAADLPIPDFALYAASKAFVASFSEALRLEMLADHVPVLAVCPGPVRTGFGSVARRCGFSGNNTPLKRWFYTDIDTVIQCSLRALEQGKARCYPSFKVGAAGLLLRNMPMAMLRKIMGSRPRKIDKLP